jgi:DNA replication protein
MSFPGFHEGSAKQVHIPEQFFRHVLPGIDKLDELKLTLYIFWHLERMEGNFKYLHLNDLFSDANLIKSMGKDPDKARVVIENALRSAVKRGTLLQAEVIEGQDRIICLNTAKGQAAMQAIKQGDWHGSPSTSPAGEPKSEHLNIFQLYEANVGPLTPMIADALRDAEKTFPENWVEDAFRIAVERNRRNWHYIEAILQRWQEGGRDDRKDQPDRRDTEEARRRYAQWDK